MAAADPALGGFRLDAAAFHDLLVAVGQRPDHVMIGLGIDDAHLLVEIQPQLQRLAALLDHRSAADQHRMGQGFIHHRLYRAQHALILALGIDDAARIGACRLEHRAHQLAGAIDEFLQLALVGIEIGDGPARHAAIHRRLRHGRRDMQDQARIERLGNDVLGAEPRRGATIGLGDHIAAFGAGQGGDGFDGGHFHRLVDSGGIHVQRAAEHKREAQDIVDLVGIVAAAGGDDGVGPCGLGNFRHDLGIGVGQRQDQRLLGHLRQPFRLQDIGRAEP